MMYASQSSAILSSLLLLGARGVAATCSPSLKTLAGDMAANFAGCDDLAKQAIRAAYHDCGPEACDGSLILSDECATRPENTQIRPYCSWLQEKVTSYGVSAADAIQLGIHVAVETCHGPSLRFKAGRTDSSTPNTPNQLPNSKATAAQQVAVFTKFTSLGFTVDDVVALGGAHTIGKNLSNVALDNTDNNWDNTFYQNTLARDAPATLVSDINMATTNQTSPSFHRFAKNAVGWEIAFSIAYDKMSIIGVSAPLTDCTAAVADSVPR